MNKNPDVDLWLETYDNPMKPVVADPLMWFSDADLRDDCRSGAHAQADWIVMGI